MPRKKTDKSETKTEVKPAVTLTVEYNGQTEQYAGDSVGDIQINIVPSTVKTKVLLTLLESENKRSLLLPLKTFRKFLTNKMTKQIIYKNLTKIN